MNDQVNAPPWIQPRLISFRIGASITLFLLACGTFPPLSHGQSVEEKKLLKLQGKAEQGTVAAELELAAHYLSGDWGLRDVGAAARWYEKAAQSGNFEAQNLVGYFYQTGTGVPLDLARALRWYQLSSASGFAPAKLNLGIMYARGLGVPKNVPLAMQLFEEGADKGDGAAACYLGQIYFFGLAGTRDMAAAERWLQVGAKLHNPIAAYNLGSLWSVTSEHAHDFGKAAELLRQSAASGYVPGMYSLGVLLLNHPEIKQAAGESMALLNEAVNAGVWRASLILGVLDRDRKGAADRRSAIYHFQVAALQGGDEAKWLLRHEIDRLSGALDESQRADITSEARSWYAQHSAAQPFLAGGRGQSRYFEMQPDPEAVEDTFVQRITPVKILTRYIFLCATVFG